MTHTKNILSSVLFGLFNTYFCLIFCLFVYSSVFEFVHSSEIRKQTDSAFSNYFVNNFFRNMFFLVLSSSLFLKNLSLSLNFLFLYVWVFLHVNGFYLSLSLAFCVALLLHTSSVLLVHAHHHLLALSLLLYALVLCWLLISLVRQG